MEPTKPTPTTLGRPTLGTAVRSTPRDRLFDALEHAFPSWTHRHAIINALADFVKSPQGFAPPQQESRKGEEDE